MRRRLKKKSQVVAHYALRGDVIRAVSTDGKCVIYEIRIMIQFMERKKEKKREKTF